MTDAGTPAQETSLPASKRRWLLISGAVVMIVAAAAVAVFAGPRVLVDTKTPDYSLGQLAAAARSRDWAGVQKYVDIDSVASLYVDQLLTNAMGGESESSAPNPMGGSAHRETPSTKSGSSAMKDTFVRQFGQSLQQGVEGGALTPGEGISGVLLAGKAKSVKYVGADEAQVTLELSGDEGESIEVGALMARTDDYWRIVALDEVSNLLDMAE